MAQYKNQGMRKGLAFATTKFPRFTKNVQGNARGVEFNLSPYYWWFRYLQLNDEYQLTLDGKKTKISKEIVSDLGTVRGVEFYDWWHDHAHLFAEPISDWKMQIASSEDGLAPFASTEALNLVIPLDWTNRELKEAFQILIDDLVPVRPKQIAMSESRAKYKLNRKWSIKAMMEGARVLRLKKEADEKEKSTGEKTAWADIGILAKLPYAKGMKLGGTGTYTDRDKRITLTILTKRCHTRALGFLKACVTRSFPA